MHDGTLLPNTKEELEDLVDLIDGDVESVEQELADIDPRGVGFKKVSRRVCLIRREFGAESTGCLVGPDLMLTAAHNLFGTAGIFADPAEVTILFDQFKWNKKTGTLAHGDQCGLRYIPFTRQPDVVASSIRTDPKCRRVLDDTGLDYVIVRLDRPMGLSFLPFSHRIRGWNDCSRADIPAEGDVFVVQHPLGGLQKFAKGTIGVGQFDDELPHHFRYSTRTLLGASGSPILDVKRRVVGLHVGERVADEIKRDNPYQLGVSFQTIFKDLRAQGVTLPRFDLPAPVMDSIFGSSQVERLRKSGGEWRGDRYFD